MSWRYRVMRRKDGVSYWYGIHEVHDLDKTPSWTEDDCSPGGESLADLSDDLDRMVKALALPVMEEKDETLVEVDAIDAKDKALRAIIANCGNPDAAEGCRLAIATARAALKEIDQ